MACQVEQRDSSPCTVSYRSSPSIRENWDWKEAKESILTLYLDRCRISYSRNQIWNFTWNGIFIVDPQHSETMMEHVEWIIKEDTEKVKFSLFLSIFHIPWESQEETSLASECYQLYLFIAFLSIGQLLDVLMFQLLYKNREQKQHQTTCYYPKQRWFILKGTFFLNSPLTVVHIQRKTHLREMAPWKLVSTNADTMASKGIWERVLLDCMMIWDCSRKYIHIFPTDSCHFQENVTS